MSFKGNIKGGKFLSTLSLNHGITLIFVRTVLCLEFIINMSDKCFKF